MYRKESSILLFSEKRFVRFIYVDLSLGQPKRLSSSGGALYSEDNNIYSAMRLDQCLNRRRPKANS